MQKLVRIKFVKDTELRRVGDVVFSPKESAGRYVSQGYAVHLDEQNKNPAAEIEAENNHPSPTWLAEQVNRWADMWPDSAGRFTALQEIEQIVSASNCSMVQIKELIKVEIERRGRHRDAAEKATRNAALQQQEEKMQHDRSLIAEKGGTTKLSLRDAVDKLRVSPANYHHVALEQQRLEYFRSTTKWCETWASVKQQMNLKSAKLLLQLEEADLREIWKTERQALKQRREADDKARKQEEKKRAEEAKQHDKELEQQAKVFTRQGQAQAFCRLQPMYYDRAGIWWIWDKKDLCWQITDETDILNLIQTQLNLDVVPTQIRTEILTALMLEARKRSPKPAPTLWIQFRNGLVDLDRPEVLQTPSPDFFITNPIPWKLGASEDTPTMDRIFNEWVGPDQVLTLYQILAYCLVPSYPIHRIFCLIGAGMNGKSKFLDLLRRFIGSKNVASTELDILLTSRFEITRLHKKLVVQMGETNFNEMQKTAILKKLSGGDLIGFEYKRKDTFEDYNYAKVVISTNNLPTTSDKTVGFYRRWLIIDFPNQFNEKKDILADIPDEEYENLARKSVRILKDLLAKREFHNEGSIEDRARRYEDHSDPLEKFIKEQLTEDPDGHVWKWEFEQALNEWCRESKFRQIAENTIGRKMKEKGIQQTQRTSDALADGVAGKVWRCWVGYRWTLGKRPQRPVTPVLDVSKIEVVRV